MEQNKLHGIWTMFLYDKKTYKKMFNKPGFEAKPHRFLANIVSLNDLIYILKLMKEKVESKSSIRLNLDMNDYIFMRKGIEPIWEDPKNFEGGTFSVKMNHTKGYEVWSLLMMYMMGETLTEEMDDINGMSVSYVSDMNTFSTSRDGTYTFIKIWDANPNRMNAEEFMDILPKDIVSKISNESIMYFKNNKKKHFNDQNIVGRISGKREGNEFKKERGSFKRI